jgi:hypothetical protein
MIVISFRVGNLYYVMIVYIIFLIVLSKFFESFPLEIPSLFEEFLEIIDILMLILGVAAHEFH